MNSGDSSSFVDYYELLHVQPTATAAQIKAAFWQQAKQHHPDVGGSTEVMQQLSTAYRTLKTTSSKSAYDMMHNFHTGATQMSDYTYEGGRNVENVNDMSDREIDDFLDSLYNEYRHAPAKPKPSLLQRVKKIFI